MFIKVLKICIGALFIIFSFNVNAGSYFGVGLGNSSWDITDQGLFNLEDSTAIRIFGGTKNGNIGFEAELSFAGYDWEGFTKSDDALHTAGTMLLAKPMIGIRIRIS